MEWSKFRFNKMFGTLGVLAGVILIQACAKPLEEEVSCNFVRNSQAQRVSWGSDVPVEFFLDSSVPFQFYDAIEASAQKWNATSGKNLISVRRGSNPGSSVPSRDGVNKIYFISDWEDSRPKSEQARTTIYWSGPKIVEADIRVNTENFQFFVNAADATYSAVHLESLLIHELGHALGLAHNDEGESVMKTSLGYGQVRDDISTADKSSMACEY